MYCPCVDINKNKQSMTLDILIKIECFMAHSLYLGLENILSWSSKQTLGHFYWSLTSHFMAKTKIFVGGFLSFQIVTGVQKGHKFGLDSFCLI